MDAVRPVDLKFCADPDYLKSRTDSDFIECDSFEKLWDMMVRTHVESIGTESKVAITVTSPIRS